MYNVIKVPMRVVDEIEDIPRIYDSFSTGDIFYYDPDNGFHEELLHYGFIEHLKKDECDYFCDIPNMSFAGKEYISGEKLDVETVDFSVLNNLSIFGQIKKIYKVKSLNKLKQFINISKELGFEKFEDFKHKVKELCNIDISHHFNQVTEEQENNIREALNSGN